MPLRRSRSDVNAKEYTCLFPGCNRRYYFKWHLQRHQREKQHHFDSTPGGSGSSSGGVPSSRTERMEALGSEVHVDGNWANRNNMRELQGTSSIVQGTAFEDDPIEDIAKDIDTHDWE